MIWEEGGGGSPGSRRGQKPCFCSCGTATDHVVQLTAIKTPALPDPTLPLFRCRGESCQAAWIPGS